MKKLSLIAVVMSCTFYVSGCSAKNEPIPISQASVQKVNAAVMKRLKTVEMSPGQDMTEIRTKTLKDAIEKDAGYSFDLTVRRQLYYADTSLLMAQVQLMPDAMAYLSDHPQEALDKKFISQRTFDLEKAAKLAGDALSPDQLEFIDIAKECQQKNNGVCKSSVLVQILEQHKSVDFPPKPTDSTDASASDIYMTMIDSRVGKKFQTAHMAEVGIITAPDGSEGRVYLENPNSTFIINESKVNAAKVFSSMVAEEMKGSTAK